ncbi:MAG TPA: DUF6020 family protein, partial [Candidatus Limiplasma sp.]|nr:DUF6020 family protein [Candidatus Limiplasma sp.]
MPQSRATGKSLLSALLWALSLAALCIPLTAAAPQGETAVSWTRTLPGTGAWFLAAVALGLGYRALGGVNRGYARARLSLSALFLAGVATLGESFAQTGTAELLMANVLQAALYFLGRAPAYYMGMVLLTDALSQPCAPRDTPRPQTDGGESPEASGARFGNRLNRTGGAEATRGSAWVDPNGAGSRLGMLEYNRPDSPLGAAQPDRSAGQPGTADARNGAFAWGQANRSQPLPSRDVGNSETSARRQRNARTSQGGLAAATVSAERGRGAAIGRADPAYRLAPAGTEPAIAGRVQPAMPTWASMLLLLLCWLPYLYAIWPGTVSNDSITQIAEIFGRKPLSNGNPVFQTGLVWVALSLGKGIFHSADAAVLIYTGAQALLMAWLLGYSLTRIAETRAPRWLVWLATAFYALCPVFPIFAFCMGKDTSFAMAVLWLTLMAWRAVQSKWPPMRTVVGLCLSAVLCALLTPAERETIGLRWRLVRMLAEGMSQRAVAAALGVSLCKITR